MKPINILRMRQSASGSGALLRADSTQVTVDNNTPTVDQN